VSGSANTRPNNVFSLRSSKTSAGVRRWSVAGIADTGSPLGQLQRQITTSRRSRSEAKLARTVLADDRYRRVSPIVARTSKGPVTYHESGGSAPVPRGLLLLCRRMAEGYSANGSGRSWKWKAIGTVPLPPSFSHGVRSPLVVHNPRPFQPAAGSSIRPSSPLA
jgi:hypothetical protein